MTLTRVVNPPFISNLWVINGFLYFGPKGGLKMLVIGKLLLEKYPPPFSSVPSVPFLHPCSRRKELLINGGCLYICVENLQRLLINWGSLIVESTWVVCATPWYGPKSQPGPCCSAPSDPLLPCRWGLGFVQRGPFHRQPELKEWLENICVENPGTENSSPPDFDTRGYQKIPQMILVLRWGEP